MMKQVPKGISYYLRLAVRSFWIIGVSVVFWYSVLVYTLDFDGLHEWRRNINQIPLLRRLDPLLSSANDTIYNLSPAVSQLMNILYLPYYFLPDQLPRYEISIDPNDLTKLETVAQNVMQGEGSGFITDDLSLDVPAQIRFEGKTFVARAKYRGDLGTHWRFHKKSWKLEFVNPDHFQGHHIVNLIIPEERSFIFNALSKYVAHKLNLLVHPYEYVYVTFNGEDLGLYYSVPQYSSEFLELNMKPDGNFYSDRFGDVSWSQRINLLDSVTDLKKYVNHPSQKQQDFSDINLLQQTLKNDDPKLLEYILDMDQFLRWQVHSVLMGSTQQDHKHNLKLYANSVTGQFEFIPNDVNLSSSMNHINQVCQSPDTKYNPFVDRVLKHPTFLLRRNQLLWQYIANTDQINDDIKHLRELYEKYRTAFYKGLRISSILQFEHTYQTTKLNERYQILKNLFVTSKPTASVKRLPQEIRITATGNSLPGFRVDFITILGNTGKQTVLEKNQEFLPTYEESAATPCKHFSTWKFTETVNCTNCQNARVELTVTNLTTNQTSTIETRYDN